MKYVKWLFIVICFFVLDMNFVRADVTVNIGRGYLSNYYYIDNGDFVEYKQFPIYSINGHVAYSIDFGTPITMWIYSGKEGFANSLYSDEVNSKIELIGHYGYEYFGKSDFKYRIATQLLIWEITNNKKTDIYTDKNGFYEKVNFDVEKNEIMNLVNNHYEKSSFDNEVIIGNFNEEIILLDDNNILSKYEISDDGGNSVRIVNNKLYIKLLAFGESEIELKRRIYDEEKTMIFVGKGLESQRLAIFRNNIDDKVVIKVKNVGIKLKITVIDDENNNINVAGLKFKIKNVDNNEYICINDNCVFETNENGSLELNNIFVNNFQIEEVKTELLDNYLNANEKLSFSINEESVFNNGVYEIFYEKKRIKGTLVVNLKGERVVFSDNTYNYEDILLENAVYGLYPVEDIFVLDKIRYKKDELIGKLKTDEFGYAVFDGLELGKYYIKQISSSLSNVVDENKYLFELKYNNKIDDVVVVTLDLKNVLPKGTLEIYKEGLIEVYSSLNNDIVYRGISDLDGKVIVYNLPLGKYYIKTHDNDIVNVEINKNNECVMVGNDQELKIEVPNTMLNEFDVLVLLGIIFIIIGFGWYLYVRKK